VFLHAHHIAHAELSGVLRFLSSSFTDPLKMKLVLVTSKNSVTFQVLTAAIMKKEAFWDMAGCSLVEVDQRFGGLYCFLHQGDDDGSSTHF
jgi:hypothetical protein